MNIENIPTLRVDIEKVGPQGFSAYEIYLQSGGTLSETEWLESLKGETGATPDVQAGETITLQPEEQAQVTRTGTIENPVFTFAIPQGKDGVQGIRGPEGPQGPEGKAGEDGKSAYQIWLDQGNEGTEQDFLNSLVGPEGSGVTELSVDTDMRTQPAGIYKATAQIVLTCGSNNNSKFTAYPNMILVWSGTSSSTEQYMGLTAFYNVYSNGLPIMRIKGISIGADKGGEFIIDSSDICSLTTNQLINAKKTFTTLPESSVAPTTDNQLVNKAYVDALMAGTSGGVTELTGDTDMRTLPTGIYVNKANKVISLTVAGSGTKSDSLMRGCHCFWYNEADNRRSYIAFNYAEGNNGIPKEGLVVRTIAVGYQGNDKGIFKAHSLKDMMVTYADETVSGKKTFTTLPESSITPTTNNQFVNKQYVDTAIADAITTVLEGEY